MQISVAAPFSSIAPGRAAGSTNTGLTLPPGVTLETIDGEVFPGGGTTSSVTAVQSNFSGNGYYKRNGFTYAAAAGWDDPSFFPIGPNASGSIDSAAAVTLYQQLGWNADWATGQGTDLSLIGNNASPPIWTVWNVENGAPLAGTGAETVGLETWDEGSTFAQAITTPIGTTANTYQEGRFWWMNNTWLQIGGNLSGDPSPNTYANDLTVLVETPSGAGQTQRHVNLASVDVYYFSGTLGDINGNIGQLWNLDGTQADATADQCRRGFLYGDTIDWMREEQASGYPAPILVYIEDSQPNGANGVTYTLASYIQPAELNQAALMAIIHGARGIAYFDDNISGPLTTGAQSDPLSQFGSPEGAFIRTVGAWNAANFATGTTNPNGISIGAQISQTDALILGLAPIINSPQAINYVTVSPPSGEIQTLPLSVNGNNAFTGIDVRAMFYQGGSFTNKYNATYGGGPTTLQDGFYFIASPRVSENTTNISATFTINDANATGVTVVGEGRSIPIVGGKFTDTFASGLTVHIYHITR